LILAVEVGDRQAYPAYVRARVNAVQVLKLGTNPNPSTTLVQPTY